MLEHVVPRARSISLVAVATALLAGQAASVAAAQERDVPPDDAVDVQAFFDGARLDQELADQGSPLLKRPDDTAAVRTQEPASAALDPTVDVAQAPTGRVDPGAERSWIHDNPAVLVLGGFAVFGLAALVLTLAVRELRRESRQRKLTFRRRSRRRELDTPTPAGR